MSLTDLYWPWYMALCRVTSYNPRDGRQRHLLLSWLFSVCKNLEAHIHIAERHQRGCGKDVKVILDRLAVAGRSENTWTVQWILHKDKEKVGVPPSWNCSCFLTHKSQNSRWHTIILVNTVHQIQDKHVHISLFFFSHIDRWKKKICYQGRMHWQGHRWDQAAGSAALRLAAFLLFEMKINFNISLA